jgi:hypothetical protein
LFEALPYILDTDPQFTTMPLTLNTALLLVYISSLALKTFRPHEFCQNYPNGIDDLWPNLLKWLFWGSGVWVCLAFKLIDLVTGYPSRRFDEGKMRNRDKDEEVLLEEGRWGKVGSVSSELGEVFTD